MRIIVRALLPMGEGTVLDPFMGSGATVAAAEAVGYKSIGVEVDSEYFHLAEKAIPLMAALYRDFKGEQLELNHDSRRQAAATRTRFPAKQPAGAPGFRKPGRNIAPKLH